jgi:hypothetical protein
MIVIRQDGERSVAGAPRAGLEVTELPREARGDRHSLVTTTSANHGEILGNEKFPLQGRVPKIGDAVYVFGTSSVFHDGVVVGGLAIVSEVQPGISAGKATPFVSFEGIGGSFNWEILASMQNELRDRYGDRRARQSQVIDV